MALNERGHEVPDPTPVEIATTLKKPESMEDMIRRFVRVEGSRVAAKEEKESFEEANDFEPEESDEDQMDTLYTVPDMIPELNPDGFVEKLDGPEPGQEPEKEMFVKNDKQTEMEVKKSPPETEEPQDRGEAETQ